MSSLPPSMLRYCGNSTLQSIPGGTARSETLAYASGQSLLEGYVNNPNVVLEQGEKVVTRPIAVVDIVVYTVREDIQYQRLYSTISSGTVYPYIFFLPKKNPPIHVPIHVRIGGLFLGRKKIAKLPRSSSFCNLSHFVYLTLN